MHCVRRAALRSSIAASRQLAPKAAQTPFAARTANKSALVQQLRASPARSFSWTAPVQNGEEGQKPAVEPPVENEQNLEVEAVREEREPEPEEKLPIRTRNTKSPASWPSPYGVFVKNLIFDATEEHIAMAFSKYGEVVEVVILKAAGGSPKGAAFVYYKDKESVEDAIANCDGTFWHGRRLTVAERTVSSQRPRARAYGKPNNSIYVGNIPYDTTDADLNRIFRGIENIKEIRVAVDRNTGWPRGFAHIDFPDIESATVAREKLDGFKIGTRTIRADFAGPRFPAAAPNATPGIDQAKQEQLEAPSSPRD